MSIEGIGVRSNPVFDPPWVNVPDNNTSAAPPEQPTERSSAIPPPRNYDRLAVGGIPDWPADETGDIPEPEAVMDGVSRLGKTEKTECQTCANRKYQDQSSDPSVSYQAPTKISPNAAASAVMSHEMEHVSNERANARRDNREIVSQSVTLKFDICPECGRTYVAGGETRTVTKSKPEQKIDFDGKDNQPDSIQPD